MIRILKSKTLKKAIKKGTAFALATAFLVNVPLANAATAGEASGRNIYFATNCYYNRTVEYSGTNCYVSLKLFKNATTVSEYTTNPQTLKIAGNAYYLNGTGEKVAKSLEVIDNRQTTSIGRSVSAPQNHRFVSGWADFMVAASKQGNTITWNN
jgi:hypothetical protein